MGASLVRALEADGASVRVLDAGRSAGFVYLRGTRAELSGSDLLEPGVADAAVANMDAVVHLAARTSVPASMEQPLVDLEQNVLASLNLLDAARRAGIRRFVFASSNATMGPVEPPAREDLLPRPVSPYGAAKLAVEGYLTAYHQSYGMTTTALRFANGYGPHGLHKRSVVAMFILDALRGAPLPIYGDGSQTRDLVHVDDLVALVRRVLAAPEDAVAGQIFQAGTGRETSIGDLARMVVSLTGSTAGIEHLPARPGDVLRNVSSIDKARRVLGYEPSVPLEDGLARTVDWFRGALDDPELSPLADREMTPVGATPGAE